MNLKIISAQQKTHVHGVRFFHKPPQNNDFFNFQFSFTNNNC